MFTTPPPLKKTMVNTRSTAKKFEKEQAMPRTVTGAPNIPSPAPGPSTKKDDETKLGKSCTSSIVKSEQLVTKPPSQTSCRTAKSKKTSSSLSINAQRKKLELEAAKAKARIEMELIDKQLAADLAHLDEEYSPPSEISEPNDRGSDIEKWVERSQQELELQHATMNGNDKGMPQTSGHTGTDGPVQQLADALKQLVTTSTMQQNTHLLSRLSTPRELPIFNGNPMEWLQFKQAYRESTEVCTFTEKENLWRLRKCLRGPAQEAVSALLVSGTSPAEVMSTLELQFGNSDVILSHIMTDMKKMSNLPIDYYREIIQFSIKVKNYVAAVRALGREEYLQGVEVATMLLSKLPTPLMSKWVDYSYPIISASSPKPRLEVLSDFLTEEAVKISTCSATLIQPKTDIFKRKQYDKVNNIQTVTKINEQKCRFCRLQFHKLTDCKKFKKSLRKDRWSHVKRFGICYKCLLEHHNRETCPAATCNVNNCGQSHHRLLHYEPRKDTSESAPLEVLETETVTHINNNSAVLLKVLPINIHGPRGIEPATALLDDGSTVSLISASLAARVGLRGRRECLRVRGAWDNTELVCDTQLVDLSVSGTDNKLFTISARVIDELNLPKQNFPTVNVNNFKHLHTVSREFCTEQLTPEVLIGQDNFHLLLPLETKMGRPNEPCATRTPLGWCLHGRVPTDSPGSMRHSTLFVTSHGDGNMMETEGVKREIEEEVRRSFSVESMGISSRPRQNSEDVRAEKILEETSTLVDGRWHVGLPWKDGGSTMPHSNPTAISRLKVVEQKIKKNNEYAQIYMKRLNHLFENDYARKVSDIKNTPKTWYLPYFSVYKRKLRAVFGATVCMSASELETKPVPSQSTQELQRGAPPQNNYTNLQLHLFYDASTQAMSAVGYWRWNNNDRIHVAFISSRFRVAPVEPISAPSLELHAAEMDARHTETIIKRLTSALTRSAARVARLGTDW